ncbi:MAG TPA: Fur family transcriptional regulator [Actinomycetes bacterium]|nr:Fur family transcriptional regulator [Actinomycetes bacterium]
MATRAESAIALMRDQGVRMTPQRIAIVNEIMRAPGYVVPLAVIQRVQAKVPGVSASTIYRTLERLERLGVLAHVHLEQGLGYHHTGETHHAHLVCTGCGKEQEIPLGQLQQLEREVEHAHGFRPDFSHHPISGRCQDCRGTSPPPGRDLLDAHAHRSG